MDGSAFQCRDCKASFCHDCYNSFAYKPKKACLACGKEFIVMEQFQGFEKVLKHVMLPEDATEDPSEYDDYHY